MAKNFRELQDRQSPESKARVAAMVLEAEKEMLVTELHRMMQQADPQIFADRPEIQEQIAGQDELPFSTLQRIIKDLGGELHFTVKLPNQTFQFPPVRAATQDAAKLTLICQTN